MDHVASASSQMNAASNTLHQNVLSLTIDSEASYFTTLWFREIIDAS
jgi:hypothetical protein